MKVHILSLLFFLTSACPTQAQLWEQVGAELGPISHLFVDTVTNTLYAGGFYYSADGDTVRGLSTWDGTNWSMVAPVEGTFFADDIVSFNGEIIVGGNIPSLGHLAKWDGENWGLVGTILEDLQPIYSIKDLHVFNGDLIVGGMIFPFPSNTDAVGLVRFDGTFWFDMDTDTINAWVPPGVIEMCDYNGELYIAGKFSIQTDQPYAYNIAKWDSESWQPVGHGIGLTPSEFPVRSFAEYQGELYIGGNFGPEMDQYNSQYIVKWNGSEYSALAEEEPCCILDMIEFKGELYVLGTFGQNSKLGKTDFAKWDGFKWCSLGTVFNGTAYDLEIYNDELYAAGLFFDINGEPYHSVVKWVGGDYVETCGTPVSEVQTHREKGGNLILSPNPATSFLSISAEYIAAPATLLTHNLLGQPILQRALLPSNGEEVRETVDVSAWPPGVYFFTLRAGGQVWSEKAVIRE